MKSYLEKLIISSKENLLRDETDEKAYKDLTEATYCSLLLFNKRRVGELQRIPLEIYVKYHNNQSSSEFEKLLTPSEKILINSLKRIVVRGKRGRGVPVLFDTLTREGVDLMIEKRHNFLKDYNPYLFGLCGTQTCISGYHTLRKHVTNALGDGNRSSCFTSTRLRKHLATISQILKMGTDELEQLAAFMGHTSKTHNEFYRLPSDIYQTAKVSKILLLAQNSCIDQYKGRNLNEIDVGDEILEIQSDSEENVFSEEPDNVEDHAGPSNSGNNDNEEEKLPSKVGNKKKRTLIKWSTQEKEIATEFFKNHIKKGVAPKKAEVLELLKENPSLFKNRKWDVIKVFIQNSYKGKY